MNTQTNLPIDREAVAEQSGRRGEPEWMLDLRLRGLESADQLELPRLVKTRIDRWELDAYGTYMKPERVDSPGRLTGAAAELLDGEHSDNLVVHRNSGAVYAGISDELAAKGVIFTDLETALSQHGDLVRGYFMKAVEAGENRLTAMHAALWNGGVFLYVPRNVRIDVPLQALFVAEDARATFAPHIIVVAEANSSVTYVDHFVSGAGKDRFVVNAIAEVFVKPGAEVRFTSVHSLSGSVTDLSYRRAVVENDGRVHWTIGEMNDGDGMSDTTSLLKGSGSTSDIKVICVGSGEQKLNLTTRNIHFGKATASDMVIRAVMLESGTAIVNGITKIEKGATGANGQQTEKVLMLSPNARGDANPILLIDEDDVKAGHAASVGQVNPDQIYYLMSRGISKPDAERLIIYGFLAPIISEIPIARLEAQLQRLVERKLGQ